MEAENQIDARIEDESAEKAAIYQKYNKAKKVCNIFIAGFGLSLVLQQCFLPRLFLLLKIFFAICWGIATLVKKRIEKKLDYEDLYGD